MGGGGGQSIPANTTSNTTTTVNQSPWQNPTYQALMLGDANNPGPVTSMLRSSRALMDQYNTVNKQGLTPAAQASLGSWNPATASSTSDYINQLNPATGMYEPTVNPNVAANTAAVNARVGAATPQNPQAVQLPVVQSPTMQKAKEGGEMRKFADGKTTNLAPYTLTSTLGKTAYFDPVTGQSTLPDFLQLQNQLRNMQLSPQFQQAANQYAQLANRNWATPGVAEQYMSPYMRTALQAQIDLQNQQNQQQINALNSQAVQQGAYGGARQGIQEEQMRLNQEMANQNLIAQGMNQAYNTAQNAYMNQQQLGLQGAQGMGALGTAQNQATLANLGALGQSAQAQQNLGQQYLNTQQQNAASWLGMPASINAPAANVINAQPVSGGASSSSNVGTSSPATWGAAEGGAVDKDSWASGKKRVKDSWAYTSKKDKK